MARPGRKDRGLLERPKGSGIWWVRVWQEGREHWYKVGAKTAARAFYQRVKAEQEEERFQPEKYHARSTKKIRLSEWFESNRKVVRFKSDVHYRCYASFWANSLGDPPLHRITSRMIEDGRAGLLERGKSKSTSNRYTAFLKHLLNRAVREGLIGKNPMASIQSFKEPSGRLRYLTEGEVSRLLEALPPRHHPPVILALNTGLRREECLSLRWEDVNLTNQVLTVHKTKSGKSRSVPLNPATGQVLRGLSSWMTSPWVFPSENPASPIDPHNFYKRVFAPACEKAKLEDVTFHTLRHTFASHLAMQGVDLYTIQTLLGHSSLRVTQIYAHLSPHYLRSAVAQLPFGVQTEALRTVDNPENGNLTVTKTVTKEIELERKDVQPIESLGGAGRD